MQIYWKKLVAFLYVFFLNNCLSKLDLTIKKTSKSFINKMIIRYENENKKKSIIPMKLMNGELENWISYAMHE